MKRNVAITVWLLVFVLFLAVCLVLGYLAYHHNGGEDNQSVATNFVTNEEIAKSEPGLRPSFSIVGNYCNYTLGKWDEVPLDKVFVTKEAAIFPTNWVEFSLRTYRVFDRGELAKNRHFTTASDNTWQTVFVFAPRTVEEIKELLNGFGMKVFISPEVIKKENPLVYSANQPGFSFSFFKGKEFFARNGWVFREGPDFVISKEGEHDIEVVREEIGYVDDYDYARFSSLPEKSHYALRWNNGQLADCFGLYTSSKAANAEMPVSFEDAFFEVKDSKNVFSLKVWCSDEKFLESPPLTVIINGKVVNLESGLRKEIFKEIFSMPLKDLEGVKLIYKKLDIWPKESGLSDVQWGQFNQEREKMFAKFIKLGAKT